MSRPAKYGVRIRSEIVTIHALDNKGEPGARPVLAKPECPGRWVKYE